MQRRPDRAPRVSTASAFTRRCNFLIVNAAKTKIAPADEPWGQDPRWNTIASVADRLFPTCVKFTIIGKMTAPRLRPATRADLPRIHEVRHGTAENRLTNPELVTDADVAWYMDEAIFLVSEDATEVQGFTCVNHQTGYVWALFVIDGAQGQGHGTALLDAAMTRLRKAGHRQAFLTTGKGTKAEGFYRSKGWQPTGVNMQGEVVYRLWL